MSKLIAVMSVAAVLVIGAHSVTPVKPAAALAAEQPVKMMAAPAIHAAADGHAYTMYPAGTATVTSPAAVTSSSPSKRIVQRMGGQPSRPGCGMRYAPPGVVLPSCAAP